MNNKEKLRKMPALFINNDKKIKMKEILIKIKDSEITNFILRHLSWIIGVVLCLHLLNEVIPEITTFIVFILLMENLAIGLSMMALFAYTRIKFTKRIIYGDDGVLNEREATAFQIVTAIVFLGVHILVATCTLIFYSGVFTN